MQKDIHPKYNEIEVVKVPRAPKGKKIKEVEVIISLQKN